MAVKKKQHNRSNNIEMKLLLSIIISVIFIYLVYASNLFIVPNLSVQDVFFQKEQEVSEEIVVIGVTAQDLNQYGMWPWDRVTWARVLHTLNEDEELKPAAIGFTIPFYGWSQPISDEQLMEEIIADNVIMACSSEAESETNKVHTSYPFLYPDQEVKLGHTNVVLDSDGILRHGLLETPTELGNIVNSMAYEVFHTYNEYHGFTTDFDPPLDENGLWYVDYSASPGEFFDYSVMDILNGDFEQDAFRGKMVLIGAFDPTLFEYYPTAIERSESMYTIEFTANCINAMLKDREIEELSRSIESFVVFVCVFLITLLALTVSFKSISICVVAISAGFLVTIYYSYQKGVLIPPFYIFIGILSAYLLSILFNYWLEWYSKKHITDVFKQYVDPKVVNTLIDSEMKNLHTVGKNRDIAVLFVDLRGFTSMSEKLDPETVVNILNEFLGLVDASIRKYDGTLDKFIGDCAMAFWGAPNDVEDPMYHACCAAVDMVKLSNELTASIYEKYQANVGFGVGIHYGQAIVGNVGSSTRLDYTAIGSTVNTASRLESNAPRETIYISEVVAKQLEGRAVIERLDHKLVLKGISEPMDVYILKDILKEE